MSMKGHACVAAARGWHVFPVQVGGKEPLCHWPSVATTDAQRIDALWGRWPNANVGIALKPSGLLVVDCDPPHGADEWEQLCDKWHMLGAFSTYIVETGSGGLHFYFRWPVDVPASQSPLVKGAVDIRSPNAKRDGGYVLGEGSVTHKGKYYGMGECPVMEAPMALRQLVAPKMSPPVRRPPKEVQEFMQSGSLDGILSRLVSAEEGNRNNLLFWAACVVRDEGEPVDRAEEILGEAAETSGLTFSETQATIRSAYRSR